jgi:hypothetical protein
MIRLNFGWYGRQESTVKAGKRRGGRWVQEECEKQTPALKSYCH